MRCFLRNPLRFVVPLGLVVGLLSACASSQPRKLRLHVGEIKEITLRAPADTSRRLLATSENPEVVDVSQQQTVAEGVTPSVAPADKQTFLLKGVTAGTVRVVFSEKPKTQETQDRVRPHRVHPDRVRKTYRVEVVNK